MKHRILLVSALVVVLAMSLSACSLGLRDKAGKKIAEKIVGKIIDGEVDYDDDKDQVRIKTESGLDINLGTTEWPKDWQVPKLNKGKIISTMTDTSSGYTSVLVSEVGRKDFDGYLEQLKSAYSVDPSETRTENMIMYSGFTTNKDYRITATYMVEDEQVSVIGFSMAQD